MQTLLVAGLKIDWKTARRKFSIEGPNDAAITTPHKLENGDRVTLATKDSLVIGVLLAKVITGNIEEISATISDSVYLEVKDLLLTRFPIIENFKIELHTVEYGS